MSEFSSKQIIVLPKERNWFIIPFLGIWLVVWLALISFILLGLLFEYNKTKDLIGVLILMIIAGLFFLNIFSWQITGKEKIEINREQIIFTKTGKLFSSKNIVKLTELENIRVDIDSSAFWLKFWGLEGGNIAYDYSGSTRRLGKS